MNDKNNHQTLTLDVTFDGDDVNYNYVPSHLEKLKGIISVEHSNLANQAHQVRNQIKLMKDQLEYFDSALAPFDEHSTD